MLPSPPGIAQLKVHIESLGTSRDQSFVVHVVANGVRGDSRVLKSAQVSQACGYATVILGITTQPEPESFGIEGVPVILVPMSYAGMNRQKVLALWTPWDRSLSLSRALARGPQPLRARLRALVRSVLRPATETPWSKQRHVLLDLNARFATALALIKPEIVHAHDAHGLPAAVVYSARQKVKLRKHPRVIYDAHEALTLISTHFPHNRNHRALALIEHEFIAYADSVITVSPPLAEYLGNYHRLQTTPEVVQNAPPAQPIAAPSTLRQRIGLGKTVPLVVYSGWLEKQRGLATVVEALPVLRDLHLAIVTNRDGKELARLKELAAELGVEDRVHVAPYVDPSQVTSYLSTASFGVLPFEPSAHLSLSLPTKFFEYTVAGIPSLASDFGELSRTIQSTNFGRVFVPNDSNDFATQASKLLDDLPTHQTAIKSADMGAYSWEAQATRLTHLYGNAAKTQPTR